MTKAFMTYRELSDIESVNACQNNFCIFSQMSVEQNLEVFFAFFFSDGVVLILLSRYGH